MGEPETTYTELLQTWERIRFFGRIFDEGRHLRVNSIRCREDGAGAKLQFCVGETAVKSMTLPREEVSALLAWLTGRQPDRSTQKVCHGAPTGYFVAVLEQACEAGEIFRLVAPALADISESVSCLGLDLEGVRGLEGALERLPGVVILAGPNQERLKRALQSLSFSFGWVNGGVVSQESAAELSNAAFKIPLFLGVHADTIAEALSVLGQDGFRITELPVRGFLFEESGKMVWHPPLGPTVAALRARSIAVKSKAAALPATQKKTGKLCLLVVEDDPDQQEIIQLMLHSEGYDILTAANGVDALEVLRDHKVDGVITDLMMPVLDGKQLIQSIRRDPKFKDLPVLVLTVIDDESRENELRNFGANDYCVKASQPKAILAKIKKLLAGRGGTN